MLGLLLLVLVPELAHAGRGRPTGFSYWIGKTDSAIEVTAQTRFYTPTNPENGDASTAEATREFPMPTTGCLSELHLVLSGDVGDAGDNLVATVRKNGANTALTCTIPGATGTTQARCENIGSEACFARGDRVALQFVTAATPAAVLPAWTLRFDPDTASDVVLASVTQFALTSNLDRFIAFGCSGAQATEASSQLVMPFAGRITALYARSSGVIAAGNRTVDLFKNGVVDATFQCVLNNGAQDCNDLTGPLAFAAGDSFTMHAVSADAATLQGVNVGLLVVPYNPGEFPLLAAVTPSAVATAFQSLMNATTTGAGSATEDPVANYVPPLVLLRAYAVVATAPGANASWRFSVRRDLTTDTALACTISNPSTNCGVSFMFGTEDGQRMSWESVPSATAPAATRVQLSIAARAR